MPVLSPLLAAVALAIVHLYAGRLHATRSVPRNWLLSAGSGVSIAYVFVHLLPEVAAIEEALGHEVLGWLVSLVGLLLLYGVELAARRGETGDTTLGWVHLSSYALYNGLVGYVLTERAHEGHLDVWLFTVAMAVHFLVNDHGLREHHGALYQGPGRWLVSVGVVGGAVLGVLTPVPEAAYGLLLALLSGGVVLNVLKEELPEERQSRWLPLVLAAAAYTGVLLMLGE